MPTGVYDRTKAKPNAGLIKKGEHRSPTSEFKEGQRASPKTEFIPGIANGGTFEQRIYDIEEWRKKQSEAHRGQHSSLATEIKEREHKSYKTEFKKGQPNIYFPLGSNRPEIAGENHWNWKGGISTEIAILRNSGEYHEWRIKVFKRDKFICQKCGHKGGKIEAHHVLSVAEFPELIFDVDNGMTLCLKCHKCCYGKEVMSNARDNKSQLTIQAN